MTHLDPIYGIQSLLTRLEVSNTLLTALIDSGAVISVIRKSTLERIDGSLGCLEKPDIQAASVNGVPLSFSGKTHLQCRWFYGSTKFVGTFYVAEDVSVPVLLGMDLLRQQRCKLDFFLGYLDVGEGLLECVSPSTTTLSGSKDCPVYVINSSKLPPYSENLILCKTKSLTPSVVPATSMEQSTSNRAYTGLVQPSDRLHNSCLVASALVTVPSSDGFYVRVLNPTNDTQVLYANQTLAEITAISDAAVVGSLKLPHKGVKPSLESMFSDDLKSLTSEQRQVVNQLLEKYSCVFAREKWDLGRCDLHKLRIDLKEDARPSRVPYRGMNPSKRKALKEFVDNLLEKDLIEPTHSEWAAPTVLVPKKDGSYRLVIDYRKLNSQTVKTSWPLPRIQDILGNLEGSCYFSNLDLATGFHQMEIEEEDQHLTSFITPFGLYQWKRMPMGLCNAPGAFQRLMELVLHGLTYDIVLVYIDDIIVFGRTFEEHLKHLELVLAKVEEANLKISPSKCRLFQKSIKFLGHIISQEGIQTDPAKIEAVTKYPVPKNVKEVRAFLGLTGFYRKFIPGFGSTAQPLYDLLNKENRFRWSEGCQKAFEKLKNELTVAPILGFPRETDMFILCTDASLTGIGAVLSQIQNNETKVIAYASKTLQKGQRNYSATKRELYAVVYFTHYFREYLIGRKFQIITDHRALVWLYSFKDPDGLVARWIEKLSLFDFEIVHRPGTKIAHADALSRTPDSVVTVSAAYNEASPQPFSEIQAKDYVLSKVLQWLQFQHKPDKTELFGEPTELLGYWHQFDSLVLKNRCVHRIFEDANGLTLFYQLCVPKAEVSQILTMLHNDPSGGHLGVAKTIHRARQRFYWPGIRGDIEAWVASCEVCQRRKITHQKHRTPMKIWPASQPFFHISCDILGPLPISNGFKYILMIGDNFTRWFEAVALQEITSMAVCNALIDIWVCRFGVPEYIHSDNGVQFTAKLFADMCNKLGMEPTRSSPYHPQGNAKVERINRTLEDGLAKYCQENHSQWSELLPGFMMAYRTAVHESTGQTPYRLIFGQEMRMPVDYMYPTTSDTKSPLSYQSVVHEKLVQNALLFELVRTKCSWEHRRQKLIHDKKIYGPSYKLGELVLVHSPVLKQGQTSKLKSHWSGPFVITKILNDVNFVVQHRQKANSIIVHYDRIKRFHNAFQQRAKKYQSQNLSKRAQPAVLPQPRMFQPETSRGSNDIQDDDDLFYLAADSAPISMSNSSSQQQNSAPTRVQPRRAAAKFGRSPGFFYMPR